MPLWVHVMTQICKVTHKEPGRIVRDKEKPVKRRDSGMERQAGERFEGRELK